MYAAGAAVLPKSFGRTVAPSDKIKIAAIGVNGMGYADLTAMLKNPQAQCVAICDVDKRVLDEKSADLKQKGVNVTTYGDYRQVLDNKDIDSVIIGTPDHWHCKIMTDACAAGKDVYCEKPVGNSIVECAEMVKAQHKYNRIVQAGQWQRAQKHFADAMDFVHSGKLGNIRLAKSFGLPGLDEINYCKARYRGR